MTRTNKTHQNHFCSAFHHWFGRNKPSVHQVRCESVREAAVKPACRARIFLHSTLELFLPDMTGEISICLTDFPSGKTVITLFKLKATWTEYWVGETFQPYFYVVISLFSVLLNTVFFRSIVHFPENVQLIFLFSQFIPGKGAIIVVITYLS